MKKRALSLLLTLTMLLSLVPAFSVGASAEGQVNDTCFIDLDNNGTFDDGTETKYATLTEAVAAALSGDTITLLRDITLTQKVGISKKDNLTIDGNGYTISGDTEGAAVDNTKVLFELSYGTSGNHANITIKNLTLKTSDRFQRCIYMRSKDNRTNRRTKVTLENVTLDNSTCYSDNDKYEGACIVNNWGDLTVKGNCKFITGEKSWAAIDLDKSNGDATLTFADGATIDVTDNRSNLKKATEPLIGFDGSGDKVCSVTNAATVGLYESVRSGVYDSIPGTKSGYDLPVCEMNSSYYGSIAKAVEAAPNNSKTTIKLIYDTAEDVTIAAGKNIELDLNGKALSGSGTGSVITNNGTLYIADSDTSVVRYFEDKNGDGCYEAIYDTEADSRIAVTGGVITGGNSVWGGGIFNKGALYLESGNIVGNSARYGGGIVLAENSAFTMDGGLIAGNHVTIDGASNTADGAGVFVKANSSFTMKSGAKIAYNTATAAKSSAGGVYVAGTFTMDGGEISNNKAMRGAGVYVYYKDGTHPGVFTMNDGTIKDNIASDKGGGVYVDDYADVLLKGTITGNTAGTLGGGVCCNSGITVGGELNVTGNKVNGSDSNVALRHDGKNGIITVSAEAPLSQGAAIGVTYLNSNNKAAAGAFTTNGTENDATYFTSDNNAFAVEYASSKLSLKQTTFYVDADNGSNSTGTGAYSAPYQTIAMALTAAGEKTTIKLLSDIELDSYVAISGEKNITIDLNGHVLDGNANGSAIVNSGTLYVIDSDTSSAHAFKYKNNAAWEYYAVASDAEIAGATPISGITASTTDNTLIKVSGGVITGGTGSGGIVTGKLVGGGIYNSNKLYLKDINVIGNSGNKGSNKEGIGGGIYNNAEATFEAENVVIAGNYASEQGGGIFNKTGSTATLKNVSVLYNVAEQFGAGIGTAATAMLTDVTVKGNRIPNHAMTGAGIDWFDGALTLSGKIVVKDNTTSGKADNLFVEFDSDQPITLANFDSSSEIGIWHKAVLNPSVALTGTNTADSSNSFVSDIADFSVENGDNNTVMLKQTEFYVMDGSAGSDASGNGTASKPYKTIEKAARMANGEGTVILLCNSTLTANCEISANTTIDLNGYNITFGGGKFKTTNNAVITFLVGNESDLERVSAISQQSDSDISYVWKFTKNIDVSSSVTVDGKYGNYKKITIDGQNYAITAVYSATADTSKNQVFYFRNNTAGSKAVEIKNLTINVGNGFGSGVCFDKEYSGRPSIDATLKNLTINMNQTIAPKDEDKNNSTGTPVINNSSKVTVQGKLTLALNNFTAAAIDLDKTKDDVYLTFADSAALEITDNRTAEKKITEPLVVKNSKNTNSNECVVNGYSEVGLVKATRGAKSGYDYTALLYSGISVSSYAVTANTATHGSVTTSSKNAYAGNIVTLTVKADKGWTLETLTVKTAAGNEVALTATKLGEAYTFTMPTSAVTVTATFMEDNTMLNFFVDVKATDYYYDAVLWAATNGITSGVDATHFAPMDITTRGQMVTFLWRAAGSPEPTATTTAFADVEKGSYYEKAVLWALEKGITNGMSATAFDPYATVTRGQTVAFLARYEGVKDNADGYSHSFGDVASDMYYSNAVAWAASSGITTGATTTTFAPNDSCTRGQIVTFIYRDIVK